jgi:hypothetical protein
MIEKKTNRFIFTNAISVSATESILFKSSSLNIFVRNDSPMIQRNLIEII